MAVEIEALELEVVHRSQGASEEIQRLIDRLEKLRSIVSGGAGLKGLASEFSRIGKAIANSGADKMASSLERVVTAAGNASTALQEYVMWAREAKSLGISLPRSGGSVGASSAVTDSAMGAASAVTDSLVNVQSDAVQVAVDRVNDLGNAMQDTADKAREMGKSVEKTSQHIKNVGKHASKSKGPLASLASSFLRIAKMRMIRAILRGIITALKEGVTNLYYYSQAVNNTDTAQAANTMDAYASAILKVKNSVAAALMPIIQAALPLIQSITNAIVTALNMFNKFVSAITGHNTWTYAVDASAQFAESLGGAAGSAKELKNQLMGFDELNILEEPSAGGGGGGASNTPAYGEMFETSALEPEYLQKINDLLQPITDALSSLKETWDAFKESPGGKALIEFFNWFIEHAVGEALQQAANGINYVTSALSILDMVLNPEKFSWSGLFGNLGSMVETVGSSISSIPYLGLSAVNKLIGKAVGKEDGLLTNDTVRTIAMAINPFGGQIGLLGKLTKKISEKGFKEWFREDIKEPINNFLAPASSWFSGIFDGFGSGGNTLSFEWAGGIGEGIKDAIMKSRLPDWFRQNVTTPIGEKFTSLKTDIQDRMNNAKENVKNNWVSVKTWWGENVTGPIDSKITTTRQNIAEKFSSAWQSVQQTWANRGSWFEQNVRSPIVSVFSGIINAISGPFQTAWNTVRSIWERARSWFKETVVDPINNVLNSIRSVFSINIDFKIPHLYWEMEYVGADTWQGKALNALNISPYLPKLKVAWYAGGGFVPDGQLFFAGEAGPEMVGRMGGQTAVANNEQIVEGIRVGVYDAMMSAMSNGGQSSHITVQIGDTTLADVVTKALNNQTRRLGYSQLEGI